VVSSAAFVVVHPLSVDRIVGGAITGMVFAWGYEKTRNLVPCVLGHAFWNFSVMVPWEL
jgi:membrane protease YdiL (CAAX protease family)